MNKTTLVPFILLAACSTSSTTSDEPTLDLETLEADRVVGTYSDDGVTLSFEFSRDGDHHLAAFESEDGEALVTTTLDGAHEVTSIFDGRLLVWGVANMPNPTVEGDENAIAELHQRPEAALLDGLHRELVAKGVDADLLDPQPKTSSVYDNGDGYFLFYPGESMLFWSRGWGASTSIYARNPWPNAGACALVTVVPYSAASAKYIVVPPPSLMNMAAWAYTTVNWWGALMRVENAGSDRYHAGWSCKATQVLVMVN